MAILAVKFGTLGGLAAFIRGHSALFFIQQIFYSQAKNMLLILAEGKAVCCADVPVKAQW